MIGSIVPRSFVLVATLTVGIGCASAGASDQMETAILAPRIVYEPGVVPDSFVVRFATTQGDVDLIFRSHWAPIGVAQFYEAVSTGVYDGARFFRSLRGFVVQFGIAADPTVSAAWNARQIADDPVTESNNRGTVVFASGGPNTRTVQLFINLRNNARLDAMGFAPIGEVVRGMDAVDAIYTGYGDGGAPGSSPDPGRIASEGEAYLAAAFPRLDKINTARVTRVWMPAR